MSAPYSIGRRRMGVRDRIIYDKRQTARVSQIRQRFDVAHITGWIANSFAKDRSGAVVNQALNIGGTVAGGELDLDAVTLQCMREQSMSGAIKLRRRYDVSAAIRERQNRVVQSSLA